MAVNALAVKEWENPQHIQYIDSESYMSTVVDSDVPWVLTFVSTSAKESIEAINSYEELAKSYDGRVKFGWVDRGKSEHLSETFEARFLPHSFLLTEGNAHWYRDFA